MRKILYLFVLSLLICKNSFAEYTINLNKALNDNNKEAKQDKKNDIKLSISGGFHFFLSNTIEDEEYRADDIENMMQNEGYINITNKGDLDEHISYSISSQIKKKFSNNIRIRTVLDLEDKRYGKLQFSNYRKIQDDLFVNTYWIKAGSDNAWDSNVNLLLLDDIDSIKHKDHTPNGFLTGYDTAMTFGADTDSGSIAYYTPSSNPLVFGVSYTPRVYYGDVKNSLFNYKDIFTVAAMYNQDLNDRTNLKLSVLGECGSPSKHKKDDNEKISDLNAIHFSALMKYSDLSIAGSLGFFGNSGHPEKISLINGDKTIFGKPKDSYYYDFATSYDVNSKTKISFSYFNSVYSQDFPIQGENEILIGHANLKNISLALDYKLYDDIFKPYIEINKFSISDNDALPAEHKKENNDGWVIILGAKSKF